jgi:hypothetical protein
MVDVYLSIFFFLIDINTKILISVIICYYLATNITIKIRALSSLKLICIGKFYVIQ